MDHRVIAGRYELAEVLGTGAFGRVWKGRDRVLDAVVAVKEVWLTGGSDAELAVRLTRAEREARNAARLRGRPHVVAVYDVVVEDGRPWIVMDYVRGESLAQAVQRRGPLPVEEVAAIARGLLTALGAAHEAGIVHRDVKPHNVLLPADGGVLLTDFGIAVRESDSALTASSAVLGTLEYMAPERFGGGGSEPAGDLFSLGVTLFYAVEGYSPFHRATQTETFSALVVAPIPAPIRAGRLEPLLAGLLDRDPVTRVSVAQALGLVGEQGGGAGGSGVLPGVLPGVSSGFSPGVSPGYSSGFSAGFGASVEGGSGARGGDTVAIGTISTGALDPGGFGSRTGDVLEARPRSQARFGRGKLVWSAAGALTVAVGVTVVAVHPWTGQPSVRHVTDPAQAASAAELGGMDALVAAAKREGTLNVIALSPDWMNYQAVEDAFTAKYGIKINSEQPDAGVPDELTAVQQDKGTADEPDTVEISLSDTGQFASAGLLAPYKAVTWSEVPATAKDPSGLWCGTYGGYMAISYDSTRVSHPPTSIKALDDARYHGQVAIAGDPQSDRSGQSAVIAIALAEGGSLDDLAPGLTYLAKLKKDGVLSDSYESSSSIGDGTTPIVLDWDYNQPALAKEAGIAGTWKTVVPSDVSLELTLKVAVTASAPHPAAARLWEEFVLSEEAQNEFLRAGSRPVLLDAMKKDKSVDAAALAGLPSEPVAAAAVVTGDAYARARETIAASWRTYE